MDDGFIERSEDDLLEICELWTLSQTGYKGSLLTVSFQNRVRRIWQAASLTQCGKKPFCVEPGTMPNLEKTHH